MRLFLTPSHGFFYLLLLALCVVTAQAVAQPPAEKAVVELLNRAAAAVERGELESADAALERALRIDATDAAIWRLLADVRRLQGKTQQSDALLAKARGLLNQTPEAVATLPQRNGQTTTNLATSPEPPEPVTAPDNITAAPATTSILATPAISTVNTDAARISNAQLAQRLRRLHARLRLANALAAAR